MFEKNGLPNRVKKSLFVENQVKRVEAGRKEIQIKQNMLDIFVAHQNTEKV